MEIIKKSLVSLLMLGSLCGFRALHAQTANWQALGPIQFPFNVSGQINGIGRVCQIKFHPSLAQKMYAVSASGGLWISNNGASSWNKCGTDNLPLLSCASVCIDFTNDSILYLGTGDPNYYNSSNGIYKSVDHGQTWIPYSAGIAARLAVEIIMDPNDHLSLVAATNDGIWKTNNGGITWTVRKSGGQFTDMMARPAAGSRTLYAVTFSEFYRSDDFGDTWNLVTNGISVPGGGSGLGMRLAVSAADSNVVYAGMIKDEGTIFRSSDGGNSFSMVYHNPSQSLVGYDVNGNGQGNYNFTMCADPNNANALFVSAHVVWRSTDAGTSWTQLTQWYSVLHTDMHHILFNPYNPTEIYNANDGGVWRSSNYGAGWTARSNGLEATEIYSAASDPLRQDVMSIGTQDNGELYSSFSAWRTNRGGDWSSKMWYDYSNGSRIYYSENGKRRNVLGGPETSTGLPYTSTNNCKFAFSALEPSLGVAAENGIYLSLDLYSAGPAWGLVSPGTTPVKSVHIPSHTADVMYAMVSPNILLKGTDVLNGYPNWSSLTLPYSISNSASIISINTDTNILYVSCNARVYRSSDQGNSWTNVSYNLPTLNIIQLIHDPYSANEGVYACNAYGVWYKNNTMSNWVSFSQGLPYVASITSFMSFDGGPGLFKLRVATYGRGVWETGVTGTTGLTQIPTAEYNGLAYPNPAKDRVRLRVPALEQLAGKALLYDLTGRLVTEFELKAGVADPEIDISTLPPGLYRIQVLNQYGKTITMIPVSKSK